jgi:hypothetical protein
MKSVFLNIAISVKNISGDIKPEKAILDFFYLTTGDITVDFIKEMRFQNTESLDIGKLKNYAGKFNLKRLEKSAELMISYIKTIREKEQTL